jgi:hypothetical protein
MRSILLDELRAEEIEKIRDYLNEVAVLSNIEGLHWLFLDDDCLSDEQKSLKKEKGPYKISVETGKDFAKVELYVRADSIENAGGAVATEKQLLFVHRFLNKMARDLNLVTCL